MEKLQVFQITGSNSLHKYPNLAFTKQFLYPDSDSVAQIAVLKSF